MSRRKRGSGADSVYNAFNHNIANTRAEVIRRMYWRVLTELSCNRFKWNGLPDSIDVRFLELLVHRQALAVFFYDDEYERFMCLQGTGSGQINMYNNPTTFTVTSPQISRTLKATSYYVPDEYGAPVKHVPQCVPIWGNYLRIPDMDIVDLYSSKLAEIDRTIEINLMAVRHPYIVTASQENRLSLINAFRQVNEGQPVIWEVEQELGMGIGDSVNVLNLGIDEAAVLNLMIAKSRLWNECMTLLGINNANQDKKERLVADEVASNDSQIMSARMVALNSRQIACKQMKDIWGLDVSVTWNGDQMDEMPEIGYNETPVAAASAVDDGRED